MSITVAEACQDKRTKNHNMQIFIKALATLPIKHRFINNIFQKNKVIDHKWECNNNNNKCKQENR